MPQKKLAWELLLFCPCSASCAAHGEEEIPAVQLSLASREQSPATWRCWWRPWHTQAFNPSTAQLQEGSWRRKFPFSCVSRSIVSIKAALVCSRIAAAKTMSLLWKAELWIAARFGSSVHSLCQDSTSSATLAIEIHCKNYPQF